MIQLREASELKDAARLKAAAHQLKSASAYIGAVGLGRLAGDIESLATSGRLHESGERVRETQAELARVTVALQRESGATTKAVA